MRLGVRSLLPRQGRTHLGLATLGRGREVGSRAVQPPRNGLIRQVDARIKGRVFFMGAGAAVEAV